MTISVECASASAAAVFFRHSCVLRKGNFPHVCFWIAFFVEFQCLAFGSDRGRERSAGEASRDGGAGRAAILNLDPITRIGLE